MKAVVLAGGQEFGQCPLARRLPRALWPLIDKPIIQHVLSALGEAGIAGSMISANGRTHDIAERLGTHPCEGVAVHYSEDVLPRGAAGCVKDCQRWLGEETFLVTQGASLLLGVDFAHLLEEHRSSGAVITVAVDGAQPPESPRPTGLYVCEPDIFPHINCRGYQDMKEQLIPRLVQEGLKVRAVAVRGRILPIRNEESYLAAMIEVLEDEEHRDGFTGHLRYQIPSIWVDPTATVHPSARVVGPACIGPNAVLGRDAVVIGPAVIGPRCQVEQDAIVHESILWQGARVGRGALVEQTIMAMDSAVANGAEVRHAILVDADQGEHPGGLAGIGDVDAVSRRFLPQWCRRVWSSFRPRDRKALHTP